MSETEDRILNKKYWGPGGTRHMAKSFSAKYDTHRYLHRKQKEDPILMANRIRLAIELFANEHKKLSQQEKDSWKHTMATEEQKKMLHQLGVKKISILTSKHDAWKAIKRYTRRYLRKKCSFDGVGMQWRYELDESKLAKRLATLSHTTPQGNQARNEHEGKFPNNELSSD